MDKKDVVHIHNEIIVTIKNNIMPFAATQMPLEIIILSKSEREGKILYVFIYMLNLKQKGKHNKKGMGSQIQRTN